MYICIHTYNTQRDWLIFLWVPIHTGRKIVTDFKALNFYLLVWCVSFLHLKVFYINYSKSISLSLELSYILVSSSLIKLWIQAGYSGTRL